MKVTLYRVIEKYNMITVGIEPRHLRSWCKQSTDVTTEHYG